MLTVKFFKNTELLTERKFTITNFDAVKNFINNHKYDYSKASECEDLPFNYVSFDWLDDNNYYFADWDVNDEQVLKL